MRILTQLLTSLKVLPRKQERSEGEKPFKPTAIDIFVNLFALKTKFAKFINPLLRNVVKWSDTL